MQLPPVVRIEPAASCNLKCLHCPTGLGEAPKGLMNMAVFSKILEELKLYGDQVNTVVLYHGGEPLLNRDLEKMILSVRETRVGKVKIVSNCKLLTSENCEMLIRSGLSEIEISLDSIGATESNLVRRRSNALDVIKGINYLYECVSKSGSSLKITISTTQFVDDYEISELAKLTAPVHPAWLTNLSKDIEIKSVWAVQWPGGLPRADKVAFHSPKDEPPSSCSMLDETITVRSNGDVVVCCYDLVGFSNLGNVNISSLSTIWKSEKYEAFRTNFRKANFSEPCKSCAVVTGARYLSRTKLISVSSE